VQIAPINHLEMTPQMETYSLLEPSAFNDVFSAQAGKNQGDLLGKNNYLSKGGLILEY